MEGGETSEVEVGAERPSMGNSMGRVKRRSRGVESRIRPAGLR